MYGPNASHCYTYHSIVSVVFYGDAMMIFLFQLLFLNKRAEIRRGLLELFTTAPECLYKAALGSLNSNLDQEKANHHTIVQSSKISSF
jgi:hypothetical protein